MVETFIIYLAWVGKFTLMLAAAWLVLLLLYCDTEERERKRTKHWCPKCGAGCYWVVNGKFWRCSNPDCRWASGEPE